MKDQKNGSNVPGTDIAKTGTQSLTRTNGGKDEAQSLKVQLKEGSFLTVEDTIKKVVQLNDNIHTRRVLMTHLEKVQSLKFGDYDDKNILILKSSTGETYEIKSPGLCMKIADLAQNEIQAKIDEVEQQIVL
jgi:hypothetical protein